jgi:P4 family phage/plasmid primase-like protien
VPIFLKRLHDFLSSYGPEVATPQMVRAVARSLEDQCALPSEPAEPFMIDGSESPAVLCFENGIIPLDDAIKGISTSLKPPSPHWFYTSQFPFKYLPLAKCPMFLAFFVFFTCGDSALQRTLQQWLGSILMPWIRHERFLWLTGDGDNGKSVFADIVAKVFGKAKVSHLNVEDLTGKHELASLCGKCLNIAMEFGSLPRRFEAAVKRLASDEPILINEKFKLPYSARLAIRLMFGSNSIPYIFDRSAAFWRRCLLILCTAKVPKEERDLGLAERIFKEEAAGIFNWILAGARELLENDGQIFIAPSIESAVQEQRVIMDPHREFIRENLVATDAKSSIPGVEVLYPSYREWMKERGHRGELSWPRFRALVLEEFKGAKAVRCRDEKGRLLNGIRGVEWASSQAKALHARNVDMFVDSVMNDNQSEAPEKAADDLLS